MLDNEVIVRLNQNSDFIAFSKYIHSVIENIDTVDGLAHLPNEEAGQMVKARSLAKKSLIQLLEPFLGLGQKKEPTKEELKEAKERFGL